MKLSKLIVPVIVLGLGILVSIALVLTQENMRTAVLKKTVSLLESSQETKEKEILAPLVRVSAIQSKSVQQKVLSQGTVRAHKTVKMLSEVSGKIVGVSQNFEEGRFFKKNDVLLTIDDKDYRTRLTQARAQVAEAEQLLYNEKAQSKIASEEWLSLEGKKRASDLVLRKPQLKNARLALEAAQEMVDEARRNLDKCKVRAPFDGRVRKQAVDEGQFVNRLSELGEIYSTEFAEVRLAVSQTQMAVLELPLTIEGQQTFESRGIELTFEFGDKIHTRQALVDRIEGEVDARTRMFYLIAKIKNPYGLQKDSVPLHIGTFVKAKILGEPLKDSPFFDNYLLKQEKSVWVVNADNQINLREVKIVYRDDHQVYISSGLQPQDKLCLTTLNPMVEGMKVRVSKK